MPGRLESLAQTEPTPQSALFAFSIFRERKDSVVVDANLRNYLWLPPLALSGRKTIDCANSFIVPEAIDTPPELPSLDRHSTVGNLERPNRSLVSTFQTKRLENSNRKSFAYPCRCENYDAFFVCCWFFSNFRAFVLSH